MGIKVDIEGFENLLPEGFPEKSVILVTGTTGSGKTSFLINVVGSLAKKGYKALYLTFEETPEDIKKQAAQFGYDFDKLGVKVGTVAPFVTNIVGIVDDELRNESYDIIVFDGYTSYLTYQEKFKDIRREILSLYYYLKKKARLAFVTSEIPEGEENKLSRYGVEEIICDGVIVLIYLRIGGEVFGNIEVRKMRFSKHAKGTYPLFRTENKIWIGKEQMEVIE